MDPDPPTDLPPDLRFLKRLVTVLTVVMMVGVTLIVVLLTLRLMQPASPLPALPEAVVLPDGADPQALTFGTGWVAVVTTDGRLLVYGTDGTLRQEVQIDAD